MAARRQTPARPSSSDQPASAPATAGPRSAASGSGRGPKPGARGPRNGDDPVIVGDPQDRRATSSSAVVAGGSSRTGRRPSRRPRAFCRPGRRDRGRGRRSGTGRSVAGGAREHRPGPARPGPTGSGGRPRPRSGGRRGARGSPPRRPRPLGRRRRRRQRPGRRRRASATSSGDLARARRQSTDSSAVGVRRATGLDGQLRRPTSASSPHLKSPRRRPFGGLHGLSASRRVDLAPPGSAVSDAARGRTSTGGRRASGPGVPAAPAWSAGS